MLAYGSRKKAPLIRTENDSYFFSHLNIFFNVFTFETESEREQGAAEREGDTEPEAGSKLRAVSTEPDAGLELTDREIMT